MKTKNDNRPPKHERIRKRGDVREDGMVFWAYAASAVGGEVWVSPEKAIEHRAKNRERMLTYTRTEKGRGVRERYRKTVEGVNKRRRRAANYRRTTRGRVICAIRNAARRATKYAGITKPSRSFELLGTNLENFKAYIESQFVDGMGWENHGEWHIDHIVPLASGKTPEEIWELCHYTNLQPMWAEENWRKGAKILEDSA